MDKAYPNTFTGILALYTFIGSSLYRKLEKVLETKFTTINQKHHVRFTYKEVFVPRRRLRHPLPADHKVDA
jgi:hypothetical protein